ncbi:MAG: hypothetical protein PHP86_01115 [Nevskiales bacterium]|nr:hypothetical protein [Nevskiales bacterium]
MWKRLVAAACLAAPMLASAGVGRMADIEVVDRGSGRSLPVYRHDGRWYVAGEPGREYSIRIRNRDGGRLLAVTSVDGVNVISGRTANPRQAGYVLNHHADLVVDGWRKSLDRVARFYFTDLRDAYATRTGRPDDVGVIGVALFRERPYRDRDDRRQPYAKDGRAPEAKSQRGDDGLGTGHGRSEWSPAEYSHFERASNRPDEVITIYYDSRRNLAARGIVEPPRRRSAWHRPDPFPGQFVADPWD